MLLHRFGIRTGSGGTGKWHGGDGVQREIEFLEPMQVSILSEVMLSPIPYLLRVSGLNLFFFFLL